MPHLTVLELDRMIHAAMKPPYHTRLRFQPVAMVMAGCFWSVELRVSPLAKR